MAELFPLIVELEGGLISSNLCWEKRIFSLRQILANVNAKFSRDSQPTVNTSNFVQSLLYCQESLLLIREANKQQQPVILLSNTDLAITQQIIDHLQCTVDKVIDIRHYTSQQLQDNLLQAYGNKKFDYITHTDSHNIKLCEYANQAYLISTNSKKLDPTIRLDNINKIDKKLESSLKDWLYELRLHQWIKNILIFIPILASHELHLSSFFYGSIAFLLFSLCSSSAYVLNDVLDLQEDRLHHSKCNRPFAAGRLPLGIGIIVAPILLLLAIIGSIIFFPISFVITLFVYYLLTIFYSLFFKRYMAIDVVVLAILYSLRIIAGAVALGLTLTSWILAFSMFIFLSLALVKRYTELNDSKQEGGNIKIAGRGYYPDDLGMIASLGAAAGYLSVMVLALYINSPQTAVMYSNPEFIWLSCPLLLFWVTRIWLLAHRGQLHSDPVVFAIRDKVSLLTGALFVFVFGVAL